MSQDEHYTRDSISVRHTVLATAAATFGGAVFSLLCWFVLNTTHLPAFGGSNVSRGVSTAGSALILITVCFLAFMWVRDEHVDARPPRWRYWGTYVVGYLAPAALVVSALAIPLSATKLYLDGLTIDQGFRTQYLTRLTTDWHLHDMNYVDMPPYYPAVWFWLGGRFSHLLGLSGWEGYQPWAIVSIAAACSALVPLWQRVTASLPVSIAIALVTTAVFLVMSAEEPYAGIVAIGAPLAAVLMTSALRGSWPSIMYLACYFGLSAATYTVVTAAIALSAVAIAAIVVAFVNRSVKPVIYLAYIGIGSMLISLVSWGPYFLAILRGAPVGKATATHYLPFEGVQVPLPMFSPTLIGGLCLIGVGYVVTRVTEPAVRNIGVTLVVAYAWSIASMVYALTGNTLLGFRLDILICLLLATAGVLGLAEFRLHGIRSYFPRGADPKQNSGLQVRISAVMIVILGLCGLSYAQSIPTRIHTAIDLAYTDTDGNGERADRFPADSGQYYPEINEYIQSQGRAPLDTIVLSDAPNFLSLFPYWGFQAKTSHYANPMGEFEKRNAFIEKLAVDSHKELKDPAKFQAALDDAPWRAPDVFIFRGSADEADAKWKCDLAEDIYPNSPNVRFRGVYFNPAAFEGWNVKQVGPFVVVVKPLT